MLKEPDLCLLVGPQEYDAFWVALFSVLFGPEP